jgi:hypothetical protein
MAEELRTWFFPHAANFFIDSDFPHDQLLILQNNHGEKQM